MEQALYGRDIEARELFHRTLANRVVLFHAPSGAGKTSLLQAGRDAKVAAAGRTVGVIARLEARGVKCWGPLRVGYPLPFDETVDGVNRYTISVISALEELGGPHFDELDLSSLTLADYLDALQDEHAQPHVFIFDQFEELLTVDPSDIAAKTEFLCQLDDAFIPRDRDDDADEPSSRRKLASRRALIAMRSDYVGGLELHLEGLFDGLRLRFCIELFRPDAARAAIVNPASEAGVEFTREAADALIAEMRKIIIQLPDGKSDTTVGPYVEPVHLQLVCRRVWKESQKRPTSAGTIGVEQVKTGSVETALADYYDECVAVVAAEQTIDEMVIREWFENKLITSRGIRGQVMMEADSTAGLANAAISALEQRYLVSHEIRRNFTWYELSHDRFIAPILESNRQLRARRESGRRTRSLWVALAATAAVVIGVTGLSMQSGSRAPAIEVEQLRSQQLVQTGRNALLAGKRLTALTYFTAAANYQITSELRTLFAQARMSLWTARIPHKSAVGAARFGDDGALYTASKDLLMVYRDGKPIRELPYAAKDVQLSPDGSWLAVREPDQARWRLSGPLIDGVSAQSSVWEGDELVFSPDSTMAISMAVERGSPSPVRAGTIILEPQGARFGRWHPLPLSSHDLALSPDGRHAAVIADDAITVIALSGDASGAELTIPGPASLVELVRDAVFVVRPSGDVVEYSLDGRELHRHRFSGAGPVAVRVSHDGLTLATLTAGGAVSIFQRISGRRLSLTLRASNTSPAEEVSGAVSSNFNGAPAGAPSDVAPPRPPPDAGAHASDASQSTDAAFATDVADENRPGDRRGGGRSAAHIQFSADDTLLLTAGPGQVAALWEVTTGALVTTFEESTPIESVALAPDMSSVVLGTQDGARIWEIATGAMYPVQVFAPADLLSAAHTTSGDVILGAADGTVQTWTSSGDGGFGRDGWATNTGALSVTTSRDSPVLAVDANNERTFAITRRELWTSTAHDHVPLQLQIETGVISHGRFAAILANHEALVADETLRIHLLPIPKARAVRLVDNRALTIGEGGNVQVWGLDGAPVYTCTGCGTASDVDLSPTGQRLVAADANGAIVTALGGASTRIESPMVRARFGPQDTSLVTAGFDRIIRVWDIAKRTSIVGVDHDDAITLLELSPDRTRGCSASRDGVVKIWDTTSGQLLTRPWVHRGGAADEVTSAAFSADGTRVVTTGRNGAAWIWHLPSDESDLVAWRKLEDDCSPFDVDDTVAGVPGAHAKSQPGVLCQGASVATKRDLTVRVRNLYASAVARIGVDPGTAARWLDRIKGTSVKVPDIETATKIARFLTGGPAVSMHDAVAFADERRDSKLALRVLDRGELGNDVELLARQVELEVGAGAYQKAQRNAYLLLTDQKIDYGHQRTFIYALWWAAAYLADSPGSREAACALVTKGYLREIVERSRSDQPLERVIRLMGEAVHRRGKANVVAQVFELLVQPISANEPKFRGLTGCK